MYVMSKYRLFIKSSSCAELKYRLDTNKGIRVSKDEAD
jgi:Fe-S cluster assembly iron-binding protein IscA